MSKRLLPHVLTSKSLARASVIRLVVEPVSRTALTLLDCLADPTIISSNIWSGTTVEAMTFAKLALEAPLSCSAGNADGAAALEGVVRLEHPEPCLWPP